MTTITDHRGTTDMTVINDAVRSITAFTSFSELVHAAETRGYSPTLRTPDHLVGPDRERHVSCVTAIRRALDECGLPHFAG